MIGQKKKTKQLILLGGEKDVWLSCFINVKKQEKIKVIYEL